ncbi:MAG: hypothetical protein CM15mP113_1620 [Pseudomonadota bacterium]|nr:MAG: hypothetical protein CM15mP113_1620 [Pseudomonadota bacterium]
MEDSQQFDLLRYLSNAVEVVEKKPTEAIFAANAAVLGAKVGYTIS